MSVPTRSRVPAAWLRLPPRTARLRLTLIYSGLFLLLGTALIAAIYLLTTGSTSVSIAHAVHGSSATSGSGAVAVAPIPAAPSVPPVVREVIAQHNADLGRLLGVSWVVLLVTTFGSAILGWFVAGRVLRPLREITDTARTISAGNLHERLALAGPNDEFKRLGDTLDDLLARLESSFEAQRRFVANASHELRTPLTVERTLLQVALAESECHRGDPAIDVRGAARIARREHERLLDALLTLASSERGLERREPVDLAAVTERVVGAVRPGIQRLSLQLDTSLRPAPVDGDPALLERLVANLIDNAVDHNVPGGRVAIRTDSDLHGASLTVSNTGARIAPDEVDGLFEPFRRLDADRTGGGGHAGLGLSIVRAIATAHHASLVARSQPDGGLTVTVRFPRPGAGPPHFAATPGG